MTSDSDNFKHALTVVSTIAIESSLGARYQRIQEMIDKISRLAKTREDTAYVTRCEELLARGYYDTSMGE